jgi:hypothetical protein
MQNQIDIWAKVRTIVSVVILLINITGLIVVIRYRPMQYKNPMEVQNVHTDCAQCHKPRR